MHSDFESLEETREFSNGSLGGMLGDKSITDYTEKMPSRISIERISYKSRENTSSYFKAPRSTPVMAITPISITLDLKMLRKDSLGELPLLNNS